VGAAIAKLLLRTLLLIRQDRPHLLAVFRIPPFENNIRVKGSAHSQTSRRVETLKRDKLFTGFIHRRCTCLYLMRAHEARSTYTLR